MELNRRLDKAAPGEKTEAIGQARKKMEAVQPSQAANGPPPTRAEQEVIDLHKAVAEGISRLRAALMANPTGR